MEKRTYQGTLDSLEPIRNQVKDLSALAGLEKKAAYNLMLAVDEIVTNIIMYGYNEGKNKGVVDLFYEIKENKLKLIFEDDGPAFDPTERDLPDEEDFNKPLEERPIGGLGIYLALEGVDEFKYEYKEKRNRNIFVMNTP